MCPRTVVFIDLFEYCIGGGGREMGGDRRGNVKDSTGARIGGTRGPPDGDHAGALGGGTRGTQRGGQGHAVGYQHQGHSEGGIRGTQQGTELARGRWDRSTHGGGSGQG